MHGREREREEGRIEEKGRRRKRQGEAGEESKIRRRNLLLARDDGWVEAVYG